jgi:hypothetical protein
MHLPQDMTTLDRPARRYAKYCIGADMHISIGPDAHGHVFALLTKLDLGRVVNVGGGDDVAPRKCETTTAVSNVLVSSHDHW